MALPVFVVVLRLRSLRVCRVSLEFSQPTARPLSISAHFPKETLSHGLRRMLTTPARAALRTPDYSDEVRSGVAQPAGVCTEESADASTRVRR